MATASKVSLREYYAGLVMQAICREQRLTADECARISVLYAQALLVEVNKIPVMVDAVKSIGTPQHQTSNSRKVRESSPTLN